MYTFWPFMVTASYLLWHSQEQLSDWDAGGHIITMWISPDATTQPRRAAVSPLDMIWVFWLQLLLPEGLSVSAKL